MSDLDSPAFKKLNESLEMLERKLAINIDEIREHQMTTVYGKRKNL